MTIQENEPRRRRRVLREQRVINPAPQQHDDRVLTVNEWCALNGFSPRTGERVLKSGKGPKITQLSDRLRGITIRNNREWQRSRERA